MRRKNYVGLRSDGKREIFLSATVPTEQSHGNRFEAVIGPFRTRQGAQFMKDYGANNPHCRTVREAEKLAAKCASASAQPLIARNW